MYSFFSFLFFFSISRFSLVSEVLDTESTSSLSPQKSVVLRMTQIPRRDRHYSSCSDFILRSRLCLHASVLLSLLFPLFFVSCFWGWDISDNVLFVLGYFPSKRTSCIFTTVLSDLISLQDISLKRGKTPFSLKEKALFRRLNKSRIMWFNHRLLQQISRRKEADENKSWYQMEWGRQVNLSFRTKKKKSKEQQWRKEVKECTWVNRL